MEPDAALQVKTEEATFLSILGFHDGDHIGIDPCPLSEVGYVSDQARQSTLQGHGMSNILVRISTVISLLDTLVEIKERSIQFSMESCKIIPLTGILFRDL